MSYKAKKETRKLEEGIEEILKDCIIGCLNDFAMWDFFGMYKNLISYRRVLSLIINSNRYDDLSKKFQELETLKRKIEEDNKVTEKEKLQFFNKADEIFVEFSKALKDEKFIFSKEEAYIEDVDDVEEVDEEEE